MYQDVYKRQEYAEDLAKYKEAITGNADIKLSIDDAGKQLIGMLAPVSYTHLDVYKRQVL